MAGDPGQITCRPAEPFSLRDAGYGLSPPQTRRREFTLFMCIDLRRYEPGLHRGAPRSWPSREAFQIRLAHAGQIRNRITIRASGPFSLLGCRSRLSPPQVTEQKSRLSSGRYACPEHGLNTRAVRVLPNCSILKKQDNT
jgi:hypothetical protein